MQTVFISGTGRCGTTILKKILTNHSRVFAFPFECRFMIDPDGVIDFYESLRNSWSPFLMDTRLKRFERLFTRLNRRSMFGLMTVAAAKVINRGHAIFTPQSYARMNLGKYNPNLLNHVKELETELKTICYRGTWFGNVQSGVKPVIKYTPPFSHSDIAPAFGRFLENIMNPVLRQRSASHWIEDSPLSLLSAKSILEILPGAKFLHIYRDPRDVVASFKRQSWAPSKTAAAIDFYQSLITEILRIKESLPPSALFELSLEQLIENPGDQIPAICRFLELEPEDALYSVPLNRGNPGRWEKDFSEQERKQVSQQLKPILARLNY